MSNFNQPDLNVAYNVNFKMVFLQAPELDYFCQNVTMPGLSLGEVDTPWQNFGGYTPGNRLNYEPLTMNFLLMESMDNYFYLVDWMKRVADKGAIKDQVQDASLVIMNNNRLGNKVIKYIGMFPTNISDLSLESNVQDALPLTFNATFRYQLYERDDHFPHSANP